MKKAEKDKLKKLLEGRFGILIPDNISLQKMSERKKKEWLDRGDRVTYLQPQDFLTTRAAKKPFAIEPDIIQLVTDTIQQEDLKIYFGMLSYHGRGNAALYTGLNVFDSLEPYREKWDLRFFLGFQGNRETSLCKKLREKGVSVFLNDQIQLEDKEGNIIVADNEPGKAANCVKSLKMIQGEVKKHKWSTRKTFVVFVDDDYVMQDSLTYLMMIISWVFSFVSPQIAKEKSFQQLIENCQKVGFVKNGSSRLQFSRQVTREIIYGEKPVMSYRDFLIELLKREIRELGERFEREEKKSTVERMIKELGQMKTAIRQLEKVPAEAIMTPDNFSSVLSVFEKRTQRSCNMIRELLKRKVRLGGRVTSLLTTLFLRYSEEALHLWLSEFTYMLHGDQGMSLYNWQHMLIGRGYAIEISLLVQVLLDRQFQDYKIININSTPHIHQSQQDMNVNRMRDTILSSLDLFRLLYGEIKPHDFLQRYDKSHTSRRRIIRHPDGRVSFDDQLLQLEKDHLIPPLKDLLVAENPVKA
ncbi:MAG: hypothetical protein NUV86_10075 [Candidatus Scalindua sp.]|nr:hypothetical protein [Candidatus Scalindua sp.]MCR4343946.1 hypothetical protein [Candidatus Scalindua sp.]